MWCQCGPKCMQHDPYLHSVRSLDQCKVQIHATIRGEDENASCLSAGNEMILLLLSIVTLKSPWPEHKATLDGWHHGIKAGEIAWSAAFKWWYGAHLWPYQLQRTNCILCAINVKYTRQGQTVVVMQGMHTRVFILCKWNGWWRSEWENQEKLMKICFHPWAICFSNLFIIYFPIDTAFISDTTVE